MEVNYRYYLDIFFIPINLSKFLDLCQLSFGGTGKKMATGGHARIMAATHGYWRPRADIGGHARILAAPNGYRRPRTKIGGHARILAVTHGYWRPRTDTGGHWRLRMDQY